MPLTVNPVDPPDLGMLPTFRRLLRLWWGQRRLGFLGLLFALFYTVLSILIPLLLEQAINNSIVAHTKPLWPYLLAILVLALIRFGVNFTRRYATARIGVRIEAQMRRMLYGAYLRYPRAFYDRHATGQVLSRATNDLYPIRYFIGWGLVQGMQSVMMIVATGIVLLIVNPTLALFTAVAMPPITVLALRFARHVSPISREVQVRKGDVTESADEAVVGIEMVQAFGREDDVRERFGDRAGAVRDTVLRQAGVEARHLPGLYYLPSLSIAAVVYFGGTQVINGDLSIGQFVLFETLLLQLVWPLEALGWITNLAQRALASAGRSFAWLEGIEPLPEPAAPKALPAGPLAVRFDAVQFAYGTEVDVLHDLDLAIRPGEIVAVCGPTGAGKTSLLNLLPRFYDPTGGHVLVGGVDTRDVPIEELRGAVALVTQRPVLFSQSLRENLIAGRGRRVLGRGAGRVRGGRRRPLRARSAGRLRHADRRARDQPLRRPAPARRARARTRHARARRRARRSALRRRHADRAAAGEAAAARAERPHRSRGDAAALHRRARRPRRRARGRTDRRVRHAARPAARGRAVRRAVRGRGGGVRRLLRYLEGRRLFAALMVLVAAGNAVCQTGGWLLIRAAIDNGIDAGDQRYLTVVVIIYLFVAAVGWVLQAVLIRGLAGVGQRVVLGLRRDLFDHLTGLSLRYFSQQKAGWIIARLTSDVDAVSDVLSQGMPTLVSNVVLLPAAIAALLIADWRLGLVVFAVVPPALVLTRWFQRASHVALVETRNRIAAVTAQIAESVSGMAVVQAFNRERRFQAEFDELNVANREQNIYTQKIFSIFFPSIEFLGAVATVAVLFAGEKLLAGGSMTIGTLITALYLLQLVFQPLQELSDVYGQLQSGAAAMVKIGAILDEEPEVRDRPAAHDLPWIKGDLDIDHVVFAYGAEPVLHGVDISVPAGGCLALVGESGGGKSTLARLVGRFYDPDEGAIRVDGTDLRDVRLGSYRRQIGVVLQDPFLFSGTIASNIRFAKPEATDEEVEQAAAAVGVDRVAARLSGGLEHAVREGGAGLSAGERQLISIARALLADPRILILDEATSNIDRPTEVLIERALDRLLRGRTSIIIAHRLSTVRRADEIVVIERGRITQRGTERQLLAQDGPFRDLAHDLDDGEAVSAAR